MDIHVGSRVRFVPSGWADSAAPYMAPNAVGVVESVSPARAVARVRYEVSGAIAYESFKLPLLAVDRVTVLG